jgi:hypothetical protein
MYVIHVAYYLNYSEPNSILGVYQVYSHDIKMFSVKVVALYKTHAKTLRHINAH